MYQIGLACSYCFTYDSKTILDDYSWWTSLIEQICKNANCFELRCWTGETDAIETGKHYGNPVKNTTTNELVFKGKIIDEFQNEITTNYLTQDNCLKWFTLIFYRDETILFLSEHYGSEAHLLYVTAEEISSVKSWIDQFSSIKIVSIDEMNFDVMDNDVINNDEMNSDVMDNDVINNDETNVKVIDNDVINNNEICYDEVIKKKRSNNRTGEVSNDGRLNLSEEGKKEISETFRKYFG